jgi:hypothetical protein
MVELLAKEPALQVIPHPPNSALLYTEPIHTLGNLLAANRQLEKDSLKRTQPAQHTGHSKPHPQQTLQQRTAACMRQRLHYS